MNDANFMLPQDGMAVEVVNQDGRSVGFFTTRFPDVAPLRATSELTPFTRLNITVVWNSLYPVVPQAELFVFALIFRTLRPQQRLRNSWIAPDDFEVPDDMVCLDRATEDRINQARGSVSPILAWVRLRVMSGPEPIRTRFCIMY